MKIFILFIRSGNYSKQNISNNMYKTCVCLTDLWIYITKKMNEIMPINR